MSTSNLRKADGPLGLISTPRTLTGKVGISLLAGFEPECANTRNTDRRIHRRCFSNGACAQHVDSCIQQYLPTGNTCKARRRTRLFALLRCVAYDTQGSPWCRGRSLFPRHRESYRRQGNNGLGGSWTWWAAPVPSGSCQNMSLVCWAIIRCYSGLTYSLVAIYSSCIQRRSAKVQGLRWFPPGGPVFVFWQGPRQRPGVVRRGSRDSLSTWAAKAGVSRPVWRFRPQTALGADGKPQHEVHARHKCAPDAVVQLGQGVRGRKMGWLSCDAWSRQMGHDQCAGILAKELVEIREQRCRRPTERALLSVGWILQGMKSCVACILGYVPSPSVPRD